MSIYIGTTKVATKGILVDDTLSSSSDNPVTNSAITTALGNKQDTLVSGTNIKTVNNNSLLGSGNLTIDALPLTGGAMHPATGQTEYSIDFEDGSNNTIGYISVDGSAGEIKLHNDGGKIDIRSYNGGEVEIAAADGAKVSINGDDGVDIGVGSSGTDSLSLINSGSGDIYLDANNGAIELRTANDDNEQVIINGTIFPILAAKSSMPSSSYDVLTIGTSGETYTAPSDGWFAFGTWTTTTAPAYFQLVNTTAAYLGLLLVPNQGAAYQQKGFIPAQKGDVIRLYYANLNLNDSDLRFVYAEGSKSEYSNS